MNNTLAEHIADFFTFDTIEERENFINGIGNEVDMIKDIALDCMASDTEDSDTDELDFY